VKKKMNKVFLYVALASVMMGLSGCVSPTVRTQEHRAQLDVVVTNTLPPKLALRHLRSLGGGNADSGIGLNCVFTKNGVAITSSLYLKGTDDFIPYDQWHVSFVGQSDVDVMHESFSHVLVSITSAEEQVCTPYVVESTRGKAISSAHKGMLEKTVIALVSLGVQYGGLIRADQQG
jgi:hypothetical protein